MIRFIALGGRISSARAVLLSTVGLLLTSACSGSPPPPPEQPDTVAPAEATCAQRYQDIVVEPFENKTEQKIELTGGSDLLLAAVTGTGCATALEREKFRDLTNEIDLCDPDNPDKKYMDCETVAEPGQMKGAKYKLFGVLDFAGQISGRNLKLKLPWVGGLELGDEYVALIMTFRLVNVETGEVVKAVQNVAHVGAKEAGLSISAGQFSFSAEIESKRPLGVALRSMLNEVARDLVAG